MPYFFSILFLLIYSSLHSQIGFNVIYEADYKLEYSQFKTKSLKSKETAFALLMNDKGSYFKNMSKYISDSLKYEKKIVPSGNNLNDAVGTFQYYTDFTENIGITSAKIYVTAPISGKNFKYEETNSINWKLINEYKQIGKFKAQKAITKKYGRNWIAWFTSEIPFPYGPYKFNKLPGLILEVYDENKEYVFSMYSFRKRPYYCKSANMESEASLVNKTKIFDYKRKQFLNMISNFRYLENADDRNTATRNMNAYMKTYNPIELSIE